MQADTPDPRVDSTETELTELAERVADAPHDANIRDCDHECHGTLHLTDDDRVVCGACRCTPDGVFLPPESDDEDAPAMEWRCSQYTFFYPSGGENIDANPKGPRVEVRSNPDRYSHSGKVILPGGHEQVYDENEETRPRGVDDEYTWDLSTL